MFFPGKNSQFTARFNTAIHIQEKRYQNSAVFHNYTHHDVHFCFPNILDAMVLESINTATVSVV
jgi:hypothetical protein